MCGEITFGKQTNKSPKQQQNQTTHQRYKYVTVFKTFFFPFQKTLFPPFYFSLPNHFIKLTSHHKTGGAERRCILPAASGARGA